MSTILNAIPKQMRTRVILYLAEIAHVELKVLELPEVDPKTQANLQKNFVSQTPELILSKGAHLTSFNAILRYIASQSKEAKIYGETDFQKAKADQWLEFLQNYLLPIIVEYLTLQSSGKNTSELNQQLYYLISVMNKELELKTFLDSANKTIADIAIVGCMHKLYKCYIPEEVKAEFANFTRYFDFISNDELFVKYFGDEAQEKLIQVVDQQQGKQEEEKKQEKPQTQEKKEEKKPKEKKPKEKQTAQEQPQQKKKDDAPTIEDFAQIDLRVGNIISCQKHPDPESTHLYCEKIDLGTEVRDIASGLQGFVKIEDMKGLCIVMANLKPRPLKGFVSNGMVMCASHTADSKVVEILRPPENSKVGERVHIEGFQDLFKQDPQPLLNPKKKIVEKVSPLLLTDENMNAVFQGKKWKLSTGYITAQTIKNGTLS